MKAMILAAGLGKRMLPLTNTVPKPLVKLKGRYLIEYTFDNLVAAGITEVVINIHHLGDQIKTKLNDGSEWGLHVKYAEESRLLDTGGAIVAAIKQNLIGDRPFIVVSGDIITKFNYASLMSKLTKLAHLVLVPNPTFKPEGDFSLNNNILGKPNSKFDNYTYANIGIFDPNFFCGVHDEVFPLLTLIQKHLNTQEITAEIYSGVWHNVGTIKDLERMQANMF